MLIPSDGSSFACRSKRISLDMAMLLVTEDMPTLAQPTKVECGAVHNKAPLIGLFGIDRTVRPARQFTLDSSGASVTTPTGSTGSSRFCRPRSSLYCLQIDFEERLPLIAFF
jgi:hypothetical protein